MTRISFLNGKFLPHQECFVHIEDRGFQFADGAYEVTLFKSGKLVDDLAHMQRFMRSLSELKIEHNFTIEQLQKIQIELFARNNIVNNAICYIQITRGMANRVPNCPKNIEPTISATVSIANPISVEEFNNGFTVMTHEDIRWKRCDIKTVNLLASSMINQKAKDNGFHDAIMIRDGVVTEATFANVFIIDKNNNLITHPSDNNILCGITRNRLIEIAKKINIKVIEKKFNLLEVMQAKELFLSSSGWIIRPVFNVDGKEISYNKNGDKLKYTRILADAYQKFIDG